MCDGDSTMPPAAGSEGQPAGDSTRPCAHNCINSISIFDGETDRGRPALSREDVDQFVLHHPGPVVVVSQRLRRDDGVHPAGACPDRPHVGQTDHSGAEPAVTAGVAGIGENFDQRLGGRFVLQPLSQFAIGLVFEIIGG